MLETLVTDSGFVMSLRWVLAVVFLIAFLHKVGAPASFVTTLKAYRLLPDGLALIAAYALIAAELVAAFALLVNSVFGSIAAVSLLAIYALAILVNLLRGRRDIDCGCSGPYVRQTLSGWLIARNIGLIAVALLTMLPAAEPRNLGVLDWFTSLAAAATFGLIYFSANHISSVNARFGR